MLPAKIEAFPPVERLENMPQSQLCSFCLGEKLRLMQRSPYSAYDALYAETLGYINRSKLPTLSLNHVVQMTDNLPDCSRPGSTNPQPPVINPNGTTPETCMTGKKYTTRAGDTCNSIARQYSVVST
jgi:hypothetical protein